MSRFEYRPHKHTRDYPYDGGFALWDNLENRMIGWTRSRERAKEEVRLENERDHSRASGGVSTGAAGPTPLGTDA